MATPPAYDPTAPLRGIYQQAERRLLAALVTAVEAGLAEDATDTSRALAERRLQRETRSVVTGLNNVIPIVVDAILDAARQEGEDRATTDDL